MSQNGRSVGAGRRWSLVALGVVLTSALAGGVAALPAPEESVETSLPLASGKGAPPLEVRSVELRDRAGGVRIEVATSGPLVWTSYRDADGHLVVEMPNSLPVARLAGLDLRGGLVESARIQVADGGDRPLTRLLVRTGEPAEHSVEATGDVLRVDLLPIDAPAVPRFETSSLLVPEEPMAVTKVASNAPTALPELDLSAQTGTPDQPQPGLPPEGVPATQLQGVEVSAESSSTVVWVIGDGEFYYSTFGLQDPPRFVVDLNGVVKTAPVSTVPVAAGAVERVRVAQFKSRPELVSRVVVDLRDEAVPEVEPTSEGLKITFPHGGPAPQPEIAEAPAAATEPEPMEESEVEPELVAAAAESDAPAEPMATEEAMPAEPMMDAEATPAEPMVAEMTPEPEPLPEPGPEPEPIPEPEPEPAQAPEPEPMREPEPEPEPETVDVGAAPAEASQRVEPSWEPPPAEPPPPPRETIPTYQATVLNREPAAEPPSGPGGFAPGPVGATQRWRGEPMTMTLKDADIKDVLRSFAQISGLNVVVQPGVSGSVTVELNQVPWDQALDQILKINNLGYELEGNIMRIAPVSVLRAEAEEEQRLLAAQALSVPLRTIIRRVSYASAEDVAGVLASGGSASILSARGSVIVDSRTNTLIIKELPGVIDTVIAVIESLDIPEPQVTIEARIIETTKRFTRTLGVDWGFEAIADASRGNDTGLIFPNNADVRGGVNLLTGASNGILDISLGNVLNTFRLDAVLQAAENEGLINILSAPKITTLNNERATIQSGLQIPIQTIANNTVSVQFVNATLRLEVTPHVTAAGTVLMDIDIQKREPQLAFAVVGAQNAPIATKDARTRVIVRDGGTSVIGGIYEVTSDQGEDRVPGLANVPILKHLFKNKRRTDENEELLIFITPRVVKL